MPKKIDRKRYLRKCDLMEARRWTRRLIDNYLGDADKTSINPHYMSGPPIQWYSIARAKKIEARAAFQSDFQKAQARRESATRAAEERRRKTEETANAMTFDIPLLEWDELVRRVCQSYNDGDRPNADLLASSNSDQDFLHRICVNYLRHELTRYDSYLAELEGHIGAAEAQIKIKERVLDAIAEAYPMLAEECYRQYEAAYETYDNDLLNKRMRS